MTDYDEEAPPAPTGPLTGGEFRRTVAADPEKWAREFLAAYAVADHVRTEAERGAFVAGWFRSAMRAAEKAAAATFMKPYEPD